MITSFLQNMSVLQNAKSCPENSGMGNLDNCMKYSQEPVYECEMSEIRLPEILLFHDKLF